MKAASSPARAYSREFTDNGVTEDVRLMQIHKVNIKIILTK